MLIPLPFWPYLVWVPLPPPPAPPRVRTYLPVYADGPLGGRTP